MNGDNSLSVLWLTPDKPADISVGRRRIADHLERQGFDVVLRGTSVSTVARSIRERDRYDAVIGTTRAGAVAGLLITAIHDIPLVVDHVDPIRQFCDTHGRWLGGIVRRLENITFRAASRVLYVYPEEEHRVRRRADEVIETDLGVEYERFASPDEAAIEAARNRMADVDDNVVVYVGGLEPIYSIRALLAAVDHLDDWTLLVVGAGSLEDKVEEAAAGRDDVVFLGTVPHERVPGYVHGADVGVALVDDPHTLKVLEYGAAGLPVVQLAGRAESRFGDLVEYCSNAPGDVADAIERAHDSGSLDELQEFVSRFDWKCIADDYRDALWSTVSPSEGEP